MGARIKLNQAFTNGALCLAAVFGLSCHSWGVFFAVAGILIAMQTAVGNIRH